MAHGFEHHLTDRLIQKAFVSNDTGSKGHLTQLEFKKAIMMVAGFKPNKWDVDELVQKTSGCLTFHQFHSIAHQKLLFVDSEDDLSSVLSSIDLQSKGYITSSSMIEAASQVLPSLPPCLISIAFQEIDSSNRGRLSHPAFLQTIRKS